MLIAPQPALQDVATPAKCPTHLIFQPQNDPPETARSGQGCDLHAVIPFWWSNSTEAMQHPDQHDRVVSHLSAQRRPLFGADMVAAPGKRRIMPPRRGPKTGLGANGGEICGFDLSVFHAIPPDPTGMTGTVQPRAVVPADRSPGTGFQGRQTLRRAAAEICGRLLVGKDLPPPPSRPVAAARHRMSLTVFSDHAPGRCSADLCVQTPSQRQRELSIFRRSVCAAPGDPCNCRRFGFRPAPVAARPPARSQRLSAALPLGAEAALGQG